MTVYIVLMTHPYEGAMCDQGDVRVFSSMERAEDYMDSFAADVGWEWEVITDTMEF